MSDPQPIKNESAAALGRLAKGKRKTLTDQERERRRLALAQYRLKRWPDKPTG